MAKAAQNGVVHKNAAARKVSRLIAGSGRFRPDIQIRLTELPTRRLAARFFVSGRLADGRFTLREMFQKSHDCT